MKLWNRNYVMVVIGQLISLFANNILHLVLTLYILDLIGTGYAFVITAISMIPMVLFMPFGGVLADRVNKKKIMVGMDLLTGLIVVVTIPAISSSIPVVLITGVLAALSIIEAFYTPCCQAAIPLLQEPDNLAGGNAIVSQIGMAANVAGAVFGGILYGFAGIIPILAGCIICFFASAVLETFIIIPNTRKVNPEKGLFNIIRTDFKESYQYLAKKQRAILKLIPALAILNFTITSMLTVAVPYLLRITLGMSSALYGIALGIISAAAITGSLAAAAMSERIRIRSLYKLLVIIGLSLLPTAAGFILTKNMWVLYVLLIVCLMVTEAGAAIFSIFSATAVQLKTPSHLLGKVMALITAVGICAEPLGRGVYGLLFEYFKDHVWVVLLASGIFIMVFAVPAKKPLEEMDNS